MISSCASRSSRSARSLTSSISLADNVVLEVDPGRDEHLLGAEVHGEQLDHRDHLVRCAEPVVHVDDQLRLGGLADDEVGDVVAEHEGDVGEQQADRDGRDAVPGRRTGELVQPDAGRGEQEAHAGRRCPRRAPS